MPDTLNEIICPACQSIMEKHFIAEKGIYLDICSNSCGGIFLDNQEIQEFSGQFENISYIQEILEGKNFMPVDEKQIRICPSCKTPMIKTKVFGIEIDTCYKCGGIFLDNGEFELVRSNFKKREKIKPVTFENNYDLEEYCKSITKQSRDANDYSLLRFVLSILFTPCRKSRYF